MYRIAILLNNPIHVDSRVQKVIRTLARKHVVHLFYIDPQPDDEDLFENNVHLHGKDYKIGLKQKFVRHSTFYREFDWFVDMVRSTGENFDFVYCNDLPTLLPGLILKKKTGCQLVYDSHEIYIETLNQFFPNRRSWKRPLFRLNLAIMKWLGRRAERRMIRGIDHFITVNHRLAQYFREKYLLKKVHVVYNCPEKPLDNFHTSIDFRQEYGWNPDHTVFLYQGVMNPGRGLKKLLRAMKIAPPQAKLVLIGGGSLKNDLLNMVDELGLHSKVKFREFVPSKEILKYTMAADIGVTTLQRINLSTLYATPNKLFEYIHAGLHILSTDTPECARIVQEYELGVVCGFHVEDIAQGIETMIKETDWKNHPKQIQKAIAKFSWENQVHVFDEIFE